VPDRFARGISPDIAAAAARLAPVPGRGRVVADGPIAAGALLGLATRRDVIYNTHNLESGFRYLRGGAAAGPRRNLEMRSYERRLLQRASESWMVSHAQVEAARLLVPGARLRYVPNVVDVAAIAPTQPAPEPRAIFVASFDYWPNRNALAFLRDEVLPRVWTQLPDARLLLVGRGLAPGDAGEDPRIEVAGFVDRLADAYARAACAVVPLLQSGGTPLKFVEALAYGLPVVATPLAAAGLEVRDGDSALLAEGADAFADALTRVLRDGAPAVGAAGRRVAEEHYSIEALAALLAPDA
jgi:glycosyltransferase involved in cell wall biosynthesis